jgi:glutaredoxin-related protein
MKAYSFNFKIFEIIAIAYLSLLVFPLDLISTSEGMKSNEDRLISPYRNEKNSQVIRLLDLANKRFAEASQTKDEFQKVDILYDAMDIMGSINSIWFLLPKDRAEYVDSYNKIGRSLQEAMDVFNQDVIFVENAQLELDEENFPALVGEIGQYLEETEAIVEKWREKYSVLSENTPDKFLTGKISKGYQFLQNIEELIGLSESPEDIRDLLEWERRIEGVIRAFVLLREVRYCLWVEGLLRSVGTSRNSPRENYLRLATVNVALIGEVATQKAVASELVSLYDAIPDKEKPATRYTAIIGLMERKTLDDF